MCDQFVSDVASIWQTLLVPQMYAIIGNHSNNITPFTTSQCLMNENVYMSTSL